MRDWIVIGRPFLKAIEGTYQWLYTHPSCLNALIYCSIDSKYLWMSQANSFSENLKSTIFDDIVCFIGAESRGKGKS